MVSDVENKCQFTLLQTFVTICLRLYQLSLPLASDIAVTERRPGDDAAILAAMASLHLGASAQGDYIWRTVIILEHLVSRSPHNYEAIVLLVRLYVGLGAGRLATQLYSRLSVKHMQHLTTSWVLFPRISLLYPGAPLSDQKQGPNVPDPSRLLKLALDWFEHGESQQQQLMDSILENGQYWLFLESITIRDLIEGGQTRCFLALEWHRMGRLKGIVNAKSYLDKIKSEWLCILPRPSFLTLWSLRGAGGLGSFLPPKIRNR